MIELIEVMVILVIHELLRDSPLDIANRGLTMPSQAKLFVLYSTKQERSVIRNKPI
jgi:hypothetical protein